VKETNRLNEKISELIQDGKVDREEMPAYSELTRRLGFEYNGMALHEYYFGNLRPRRRHRRPRRRVTFRQSGSIVVRPAMRRGRRSSPASGRCRGVGWAICYEDPENGRLSNHWITLHEVGNVAGFRPILVMDVWEHAYLLDYKPAEKSKYIEAFFANIDWEAVEARFEGGRVQRAA
jgi:Fe-Mn family superoxide dismutase